MPSTDNSKKSKPNRLGRGLGSLFSSETLGAVEPTKATTPVPKKDAALTKPHQSTSPETEAKKPNSPAHVQAQTQTNPESKEISHSVISAPQSDASKTHPTSVQTQKPVASQTKMAENPKETQGSKAETSKITPQPIAAPIQQVEAKSEVKEEHRIWMVPVDKVRPAKDQPRKEFKPEELKELSLSIRQKGIIQPITVRKGLEGDFEIVAGERRWRAAQQAGLHEIPVIIKRLDKQAALEIALIENIQRQDLNPIEESEAYNYLLTKYHLTQQQLADKVGKERATVANSLRLLVLAPEVRMMVKDGQMSVGHAKVLLSLPDHEAQRRVAKKILNLNLSVRATEKLVSQAKGNLDEKNLDKLSEDLGGKLAGGAAQELQKLLGRKVSMDYKAGKGKLSIHFHSDEELSDVIEKLKNSWKN